MQHHWHRSYSLIALVSLVCGFLISCGSQNPTSVLRPGTVSSTAGPQQSESAVSQADRWVPPVILRNPSPGQLDVYVIVTMGGYERSSREMTTIGLDFEYRGKTVQFAGSERLTCNGSAISLHNRAAAFQIADAPSRALEGRPFTCNYKAGSAATTFAFTIPRAPLIRSPQDLARVTRGKNVTVTYSMQGGQLLGIVATATTAKAIARLQTPDAAQATLDTSAFPEGPGSISLTQQLALQVSETGPPFKSFQTQGMGMTMVSVTWV